MTDPNRITAVKDATVKVEARRLPHLGLREPFSRSNGTIIARLYERLTKASRRRYPTDSRDYLSNQHSYDGLEAAYRQGVYDAFKALQEELNVETDYSQEKISV